MFPLSSLSAPSQLPLSWPPAFEDRFDTFSSFATTDAGAEGSVEWPRINRLAAFLVVPSLLSAEEVLTIRTALPAALPFELHEDSVDGGATHEFWVWNNGQLETQPHGPNPGAAVRAQQQAARATLGPMLSDVLTQRLAPLVSARYADACGPSGCVACSSLIRRYLPGERRSHPQHFDLEALATIVVSLQLDDDEYDGGLYVHTGGRARPLFVPLPRGSAIVHTGDLLHGVRVTRGARWSWVTWFGGGGDGGDGGGAGGDGDAARRCDSRHHARWDAAGADAGDPVSQLLRYFRTAPGTPGRVGWLREAAAAGFARAQNELGLVLARGAASDGLAGKNLSAAEEAWAAAAPDDCHAAANLAKLRWRQGERAEATRLLGEARRMGNRRAEATFRELAAGRPAGGAAGAAAGAAAARAHRAGIEARERQWLGQLYGAPEGGGAPKHEEL
eukprot:Transcript_28564.p1 GENE.Transcript_28564~~Transcript_28564.p1  ORF type:complete len:501 (-),score=130.67 Transcript_28564:30-1370(-)